jgi:hypothetical protein
MSNDPGSNLESSADGKLVPLRILLSAELKSTRHRIPFESKSWNQTPSFVTPGPYMSLLSLPTQMASLNPLLAPDAHTPPLHEADVNEKLRELAS